MAFSRGKKRLGEKMLLREEGKKKESDLLFKLFFLMLPSDNRIKRKNDFSVILEKGETVHSELMVVKFLENNLKETRFGFIVSRKVSSKAVSRNRVKRILREQIRLRLPKIKKGLDVVIIAKKEIVGKTSLVVGSEFDDILAKQKILK